MLSADYKRVYLSTHHYNSNNLCTRSPATYTASLNKCCKNNDCSNDEQNGW